METYQGVTNSGVYCPVCKTLGKELFEKFGDFSLYKCLQCDLVYSFPMKALSSDEYADFYNKTDFHEGFATALSIGQVHFLSKNKNKKKNSGKKILDIGTSTGLFVYEAKKYGFNSFGLETDEGAVVMGKKLFPENVIYKEDLEKFLERKEKFDFVTLFEVLEHVQDPVEILEDSKKLLHAGGKLAIFVPNRNRSPKLYQEMIDRGIDIPPHHLTKWSKKSLVFVLNKIGFTDIVVKDIGKYRFPLIPGIGIASVVRSKIINQEKGISINSNERGVMYRSGLRGVYSFLARTRFLVDMLLFFWIDIMLKLCGYEKDGLYIEAEI
jgi:SAM-dependent methyltransferase